MDIFVYTAIAILIALLSSRLMKKIKLPNVTGYLLTGIIVGPCVLGLFFNGFDFANSFKEGSKIYDFIAKLSWISTLALGFIAFTIGNNFKFSTLKQLGKRFVIITVFEALGAAIFVLVGLTIGHYIEAAAVGEANCQITWPLILTLSAISCATAPAATLLVIKQYKANGPLVRTLLPVVALDDAAALILFSILFSIAKSLQKGQAVDVGLAIFTPLVEIMLSLAIGAVLGFFISWISKFFKSRANKFALVLFAIALNIGIYYACINHTIPYFGSLELSSLLMCMATSAIYINFYKGSDVVMDRINLITPTLFMLFFVMSGAQLNLTIFASDQLTILLAIAFIYLIFRVIGKYLGAWFGTEITKCEPTVKKYLGFTLIPQAGVAIGLATSASTSLGSTSELGSLVVASILISTIIYELIGPVITKITLVKANEISKENL